MLTAALRLSLSNTVLELRGGTRGCRYGGSERVSQVVGGELQVAVQVQDPKIALGWQRLGQTRFTKIVAQSQQSSDRVI